MAFYRNKKNYCAIVGGVVENRSMDKTYPLFPKADAVETPVERDLHDRWVKAGIIPDTTLPAMAKQGE